MRKSKLLLLDLFHYLSLLFRGGVIKKNYVFIELLWNDTVLLLIQCPQQIEDVFNLLSDNLSVGK